MNNPVYQKNFKILENKWPTIIEYFEALDEDVDISFLEDYPEQTLIYKKHHLSSCYNRNKEAETQNSTIPLSATKANLYGVGLGDGITDLLKRNTLTELNVYILSPIIFYVYINFFDASKWLNDKRVHLSFAHDEQKLKYPYAVNTGELPFAEDTAMEIKNLIQVDRNRAQEDRQELINSALYKDNFKSNQKFIKRDNFVDALRNKHRDKKFVVIAGGPTATEQFAWIKKQREEFIVITASTALIPLEIAQIIPDYVVILDAALNMVNHFNFEKKIGYENTTLIYSPVASHEAIKEWSGLRKIFLSLNPLLNDLIKKNPQAELYSGGSVAHSNVALALLLGAKELYLVGYDFCFPFEKSHLEHSTLSTPIPYETELMVVNGYNKKVKSLLNLISYKDALEQFIVIHPEVSFYNTGKDGAEIKGAEWITL